MRVSNFSFLSSQFRFVASNDSVRTSVVGVTTVEGRVTDEMKRFCINVRRIC